MTFHKKILLVLDNERGKVFGLVLMMVLGAGLEALGVGLIVPFVALVANPDPGDLTPRLQGLMVLMGAGSMRDFLIRMGLGLGAVFILKNAYLSVLYRVQFRFLFHKQSQLAARLFDRFMRAPYPAYLERNSAELIRIVNSDVFVVFWYVVNPTFLLIAEGMVALSLIGLLLILAPLATALAAGLLGTIGLFYYLVLRKKLIELALSKQDQSTQMMKWVQQGLGGFKEARILKREGFFVGMHERNSRDYADAAAFVETMNSASRLFIETIFIGGLLLVLTGLLVRGADAQALVPTIALLAAASFRLMPSLNRIMASVTAVRHHLSYLDVACRDLGFPSEVPSAVGAPSEAEERFGFERGVELRDVVFRYQGASSRALDGVSLSIPKGSSVALVGASGGGKSTALDVLLGLLRPEMGEVLVDGVDIHSNLMGWHRKIGYIPQPVYLYDDTIRSNVAFGIEKAAIDDEKVWSALAAASLDEFVKGLPRGLDTLVGERGVRMSGGQRQRVGIARVLYHDPEILVLDEATAGLDNETEAEIVAAISALSGKKTLVIVAHRLSTVKRCDKLFLLKAGRLIAEGPYAQLLASSSDFQSLASAA